MRAPNSFLAGGAACAVDASNTAQIAKIPRKMMVFSIPASPDPIRALQVARIIAFCDQTVSKASITFGNMAIVRVAARCS
ncbi:MAG: hypothetical protein ACR2PF_07685, partial [Rhizobiaceae bacterium]